MALSNEQSAIVARAATRDTITLSSSAWSPSWREKKVRLSATAAVAVTLDERIRKSQFDRPFTDHAWGPAVRVKWCLLELIAWKGTRNGSRDMERDSDCGIGQDYCHRRQPLLPARLRQ